MNWLKIDWSTFARTLPWYPGLDAGRYLARWMHTAGRYTTR